ncbi:hypothetical protein BC829DRAFT_43545 [Chytridium lagenaria]|nr:hypothetical protein BC829DRAFT_43545 [Chytridium lagenaria]
MWNSCPSHFHVECCANDSTQTLSLEGRDVESKKEPIYTSFPPPLSYRASNCRLISTVREWMLDSEEVSLWRNLAWCDVRRSDFTDARDLFDVIAINIYDLLKEIVTFEKFYENSQVVKVSHSSMEETALSSADWRYYNKISSSLPSLCSDVVLGLVVDLAFNEDYMKNTTLERPPLGDVITTDLSAYRRPNGRFNALGNMQFLSKKNKGDILNSMKIQYRARKYQALAEQSPETFAESTKNLSGREGKRERMVFKGELRRISKIPEKYRNKLGLQLEFEDMLGISKNLNTNDIVDKPKVSLDSWCWTEILDSSSLTEVLQEAKHHLSVAVTRRSENDGRLLLALHGPGKVCDESFTFFEQVKVKTKVDFGLFHDLFKNNKNVLDPLAPSAEQLEEKPSTVIDSEKSQSPEVHFETKLQTPPSAMDDFGVIDMSTYLDASESSLLEEEDDGQILAAHNNSNNVSRAVSPTKAVDASQIATPKASDIVYDMGGRIVHESDQNTVLYTSFGTQVRIHKELTSGALLRRRESRGGILVKILSGPNILSFSAGNPLPQSSPSYRLQNPETASLMLSSEDGTILSVSGKSASFYSTNNAKAAAALITPTVSVNASSTPYPYPSQPSAPPVSLATLSLADGSVTEIRTNGSILLKSGEILKAKEENVFLNDKTESLTEQLRSLEAKEIARSILPNGSVVSYLSNRACRVIFPNGKHCV